MVAALTAIYVVTGRALTVPKIQASLRAPETLAPSSLTIDEIAAHARHHRQLARALDVSVADSRRTIWLAPTYVVPSDSRTSATLVIWRTRWSLPTRLK